MPQFILCDEPITGLSTRTFGDFWSWAYSDILSNATRSVLAEYIVGFALDVLDQPRVEWDACDLRYRGKRIEVKASAYLQSWGQKRLSTLVFDIGRHVAWDAGTNTYAAEPLRTADCYVFCVFTDKDRKDRVVADVSRWLFYVAPTTALDERFGSQKHARLSSIERVAISVQFGQLRTQIDRALGMADEADAG